MTKRPPIAVVGVSALFPNSPDAEHFWRNIVDGADLLSDIPESHWRLSDYYDPGLSTPDKMYARRGGFLPYIDFSPAEFGIPPNVVPATDTAQLLALAVAKQVLEDVAGGDFSHVDRERISVVLGAGSATEMLAHMAGRLQAPVWDRALRGAGLAGDQLESFKQRIAAAYTPWQENTFPGMLGNVVAGRIANRFDLGGTNCVVDAACASSLAAIEIALNELYLGDSEMVITGGVDALNDILMFMCFAKVTALSPSGDCRPFSDNADGTMLGEGLAMMALKRLEDAERDGDPIYAVIRGMGSSSDGRAKSVYAPSPQGQAKALRRAYEAAGYGPETVELLEAHGTGTKAGDAAEFSALREVFDASGREDRQWCALGSVKSQVGHTKAASGACGLFKAVMALHHKTLPPTIKVSQPNPTLEIEKSPFYLSTHPQPWIADEGVPRRASVSSFGFGGTNFHVTLEEYTGSGVRAKRHRSWKSELVVLGASTAAALATEAARLSASLEDDKDMLRYIAQETQSRYDAAQQHRLALVADDLASLRSMLDEAAGRLADGNNAEEFASPKGYCYSSRQAGPVALLFPGQGSQYVGMGADIPQLFEPALSPWEAARASLLGTDCDLHKIVWPKPAFSEEARAEQTATLIRTEWAQPALGAHSLSLLQILRALDIQPIAVGGHSFGEVVALCAAGVFDDESALRIARKRGALMAEAARTSQGTMCAVTAPREIVQELLQQWGLPVTVANHNSPTQVIVSGAASAVAEATERLSAVGIKLVELKVATAFHSEVVAASAEPFGAYLADIPFNTPAVPVYANATAKPYDGGPDEMRATLAGQIAQPVRFVDQVRSMWTAGARTFVEVGPDGVLTNLVGKCLEGLPHNAIALDRKRTNGVRALWLGLAQLVAAGVPMNFSSLWADYRTVDDPRSRQKPKLVLKINGANYGKPQIDEQPTTPPSAAVTATVLGTTALTSPGHHNGVSVAPTPQPVAPPPQPVVAMPEPAVAPVVEAPAGAGFGADLVADMLQVVADKTGYPVEILDLSMALEADLGIDSIKRVEILSAVQQRVPSLPEVEASALAELSTLQEIVDYLTSVQPPPAHTANGNGHHNGVSVAPTPRPVAAVPEPAVEAPAGAGFGADLVADMLQVVADKTGYPVEILDLSMALEADLGIDSIKRVEILSAVQQRVPSLPEVEASALAELSTLQEIVDYLTSVQPPPAHTANGNGHHTGVSAAVPSTERGDRLPFESTGAPMARYAVRAIAAPVRGMGVPGLHEATRVEIVGRETAVADALQAILRGHGISAVVVDQPSEDSSCVLHLGGLGSVRGCEEALAVNHRVFADALRVAPRMELGGGVFVTVQDTGGTFGLLTDAGSRAWAGGVAALTKTVALEWPNTYAKAIDIDTTDRLPQQVAEGIATEILAGGPELEVGLGSIHGRVTVATEESRVTGRVARLDHRDVVLVSGGARGVTAASVIALAKQTQASFVLVGRSALGDEPSAAHGQTTDVALKRALLADAQRQGIKPTPRQLEQQVRRVQADREIRATIAAIEAAGSRVVYQAIDVRDSAELGALLDRVRTDFGPITALVHGAGVLADARLSRKTIDQFDQVFGTKVAGLSALLDATASDALKTILLFSSVSARGGNIGQSDYAMANEVLNQVALAERSRRGPSCLVRSLGWGPWGAGMVTPALQAVFESRGITPISLDDGACAFVSEALDSATQDVQFLLGGGVIAGGLPHPLPDTGRLARVAADAEQQPYLQDHRVQHQVVLPVVQVAEWFVRAAEGCRPGQRVTRLLDLRVLRGVQFPDFDNAGEAFVVRCVPIEHAPQRLELSLLDAAGMVRYCATVEVGSGDLDTPVLATAQVDPERLVQQPCYGDGALFHGPAFQVIERLTGCEPSGAIAQIHGLNQAGWPQQRWATDPAALDGCLQLGFLWGLKQTGRRVLPLRIGQIIRYRTGPAEGTLYCHLEEGESNSNGIVCDLRLTDDSGALIAECRRVEMYAYGTEHITDSAIRAVAT
ncbi:type I polyketide synthase [Mycobacterium riyadhense]|uniref:type I polyketide synthase n=1 Tax=Mycobacterium riyadhense TaxID=486698 RepID=UPI00195B7F62|nr:type I polyketide synthase [Mycobacterium riyadhense]